MHVIPESQLQYQIAKTKINVYKALVVRNIYYLVFSYCKKILAHNCNLHVKNHLRLYERLKLEQPNRWKSSYKPFKYYECDTYEIFMNQVRSNWECVILSLQLRIMR